MTAEAEFVGSTDVQLVAPFPESRLGLPGLLTTLADVDPIDAYERLVAEGHVNDSGDTYPLPETELRIGASVFKFSPIHSPFAERAEAEDEESDVKAEDVTRVIDEQLKSDKAVVLLYKANADPDSKEYKWIMLTGYYSHNGEKGPYHTIDPKEDHPTRLSRNVVGQMIQRSLDHIDAYACTIEASPAS